MAVDFRVFHASAADCTLNPASLLQHLNRRTGEGGRGSHSNAHDFGLSLGTTDRLSVPRTSYLTYIFLLVESQDWRGKLRTVVV